MTFLLNDNILDAHQMALYGLICWALVGFTIILSCGNMWLNIIELGLMCCYHIFMLDQVDGMSSENQN